MRIALFDYRVVRNNPVGGCHLDLLRGLHDRHRFVVFATEFQNPCPDHIGFIRIPAPRRPLALLFIAFHFFAPIAYIFTRVRRGLRFDRIQFVESNVLFGDIAYVHFCHRAFLDEHWAAGRPNGLRRPARWLDHWLHALIEPIAFRRATMIVVPSRGLAAELIRHYPWVRAKVTVLANPVDTKRFEPAADFEPAEFRARWGFSSDDVVLSFVALGHFERKGLPQLIDAMAAAGGSQLKLFVVGGTEAMIAAYRRRAKEAGLDGRIVFAGSQRDIRPFLWAADAFVLPSRYEVFPLVGLEAAAAGLPLIVTSVYGLEEFVRHGENGLVIETTVESLVHGLTMFLSMSVQEREQMGASARRAIAGYGLEPFADGWRAIYRRTKGAP